MMRLLLALVLALAMLAGLVALIMTIGGTAAATAGKAAAQGPIRSGVVPKLAFVLLWLLVAGTSAGLIGGA